MKRFGVRLVCGMGAALIALLALCPMSRASEAEATGQGTSLGVEVAPLGDGLRESLGYRSGVLVKEVTLGGLADQAGIMNGDVLVVVGSVTLGKVGDLARAESAIEPGQPVSIVFSRDGGRLIKMVKVEPPPVPETRNPEYDRLADEASQAVPSTDATKPEPVSERAPEAPSGLGDAGLKCADLDADLAAARGLPRDQGALVRGVAEHSPAALAGIRAGDVIVWVGDQRIWGADHLHKVVSSAELPVEVAIQREGVDHPVELRLEAPVVPVSAEAAVHQAPAEDNLKALREEVRMLRQEIQALRDQLTGFKDIQPTPSSSFIREARPHWPRRPCA